MRTQKIISDFFLTYAAKKVSLWFNFIKKFIEKNIYLYVVLNFSDNLAISFFRSIIEKVYSFMIN